LKIQLGAATGVISSGGGRLEVSGDAGELDYLVLFFS
jgi:hypothetical protein